MFCKAGGGFVGLADVLRVEVLTEFSQAVSGIDGIGVVVGWVGCGAVVVRGPVIARSVIDVVVVDVVAGSLLGLLISSSSSKCQVELVGGVGIGWWLVGLVQRLELRLLIGIFLFQWLM
jgi:hypothetical protein